MDGGNQSTVSEFVLLGLGHSWSMQVLLFMIFLLLYVIIVSGNIVIVTLIITDPHLHSPMYFFLANLSFVDMWLSSDTTPKMITEFLRENKTISFAGCMCQIFFAHFIAASEMVLLVSMAYDRYVAICKPLHYSTIMSLQRCTGLVVSSWMVGFIHTTSQIVFLVGLPFCGPNVVDSIFCDLPLVIKLACTDTYVLELLVIVDSGLLSLVCFILLVISYIIMFVTLWQHSSRASSKAVSTLSAHITVVILSFGPDIFIYSFPFNSYSVDKFLSVFYILITPFLNPIIYTLRNQEMKGAIKRLCSQNIVFCLDR
ncbi:olfactory receptor 4K13-like [Marmota monax]|uniref:olfactory receptor 4K13-like n=1 Tax=Marmota monax TaxID=9995 RepID=UPI001EB03895|nr:olfactory receptor 4K13-like [Marmota monax]